MGGEPPSGTVTLLFTDIEGSTRLWEAHPDAMRDALSRHDVVVRDAVEAAGGYVFKTVGDAFCVAFAAATDAVRAAVAVQQALVARGLAGAGGDPGADGIAHRGVQRTRR